MDPVDLGPDTAEFLTALPHRVPVLAFAVDALGNDLEHELGGVLVIATAPGAVPLKVVEQRTRVLADVAKVDRLAALGQEQQAVELLEEDGVGLVDGAQHGLAGVGELAEEDADGPGALRVEAAGGLVEEEEQLGLGDELDADGEELALLDVEALAGYADDGVGVLFHAEHLDDFLDELELFLFADGLGAAQHGAEAEGFADRGRVEVEI